MTIIIKKIVAQPALLYPHPRSTAMEVVYFIRESGITNAVEMGWVTRQISHGLKFLSEVAGALLTDPEDLGRFIQGAGIRLQGIMVQFLRRVGVTDPSALGAFAFGAGISRPGVLASFARGMDVTGPSALAAFALESGIKNTADLAHFAGRAGLRDPILMGKFARGMEITEIAILAEFARDAVGDKPFDLGKIAQGAGITDTALLVDFSQRLGITHSTGLLYFVKGAGITEPSELVSLFIALLTGDPSVVTVRHEGNAAIIQASASDKLFELGQMTAYMGMGEDQLSARGFDESILHHPSFRRGRDRGQKND